MKFLPHQLTDNIRRTLPPDAKKRLGIAALTMSELIERQTIRTEKDFQNQVAAYLRMRGIPFYKSRMDKRTTNKVGQPDFICCVPVAPPACSSCPPLGRFVALECKQEDQEPTPEQWREIEAIKAAGGIAMVVCGLNGVKAIVDELMK